MDLSIVIVNWNTRDLLANCLQSIVDAGDQVDFDTHVVDNASADGSAEMVRARFPAVQLIANRENVGYARANNQGIRCAAGRHVMLLNSDTEVRPGAIQSLVEFMDQQPKAGAAGARLLNPDGTLQLSCHPMLTPGREFWHLVFLDRVWPRMSYPARRCKTDRPRRVEVIKGACLVLRREALHQVGLLDERYFMYTEEVDLCYRLALAGWQLWWFPQAQVLHHEAQSTRQVAERMYLQLYRSKVQFYLKFGGTEQAGRFKRLVRLAYWPRWVVSAAGAPFSTGMARQACLFRRLLVELPAM